MEGGLSSCSGGGESLLSAEGRRCGNSPSRHTGIPSHHCTVPRLLEAGAAYPGIPAVPPQQMSFHFVRRWEGWWRWEPWPLPQGRSSNAIRQCRTHAARIAHATHRKALKMPLEMRWRKGPGKVSTGTTVLLLSSCCYTTAVILLALYC